MNMLAKTFIIISLSSLLVITGLIDFSEVKAQQEGGRTPLAAGNGNGCISYDSVRRMITVSCKSATLTDIYNQLNDPSILNKEQQRNGVWLLNANITINKGSTLTIDPTDTTWLKIIADEKSLAYGI